MDSVPATPTPKQRKRQLTEGSIFDCLEQRHDAENELERLEFDLELERAKNAKQGVLRRALRFELMAEREKNAKAMHLGRSLEQQLAEEKADRKLFNKRVKRVLNIMMDTLPSSVICPLTLDTVVDAQCVGGSFYSKVELQKWLDGSNVDPVTKEQIDPRFDVLSGHFANSLVATLRAVGPDLSTLATLWVEQADTSTKLAKRQKIAAGWKTV